MPPSRGGSRSCARRTSSCSPRTTASTRPPPTRITRASTSRCSPSSKATGADGTTGRCRTWGRPSCDGWRRATRRSCPGHHSCSEMPELPEVETIRRQLAPHVERRRLARVEIADPRWCLPLAPAQVVAAAEGRVVETLGRRGKYLVWELEADVFLLMHLRMTGTLLYDGPSAVPYQRVRFLLDDGHAVTFCDPRRFGTGELAVGRAALDAFFAARLGIEPLE